MLPLLTEVPVGSNSVVSRSYGAFLQLHANTIVPVFPLVAGRSLGFGGGFGDLWLDCPRGTR